MQAKSERKAEAKGTVTHRASVSFPTELYGTLEAIARQKKVSVAWVVRDAAEKYVEDQWPLLSQGSSAR